MSELDSFMKWFEENHPRLYEKYQGNITISPVDGQGVAVNNNNKISQKEFEHLNRVASTYYTKKDIEEFDTIEFNYAPDRRKDESAELNKNNNAIMWFRPIINQINRQGGRVIIWFTNTGIDGIGLEHVDDDLKKEAKRLLKEYETPFFGWHNQSN